MAPIPLFYNFSDFRGFLHKNWQISIPVKRCTSSSGESRPTLEKQTIPDEANLSQFRNIFTQFSLRDHERRHVSIREGEFPTFLARAVVHAPGSRFFLGRRAVRGAFVSSQATVIYPE